MAHVMQRMRLQRPTVFKSVFFRGKTKKDECLKFVVRIFAQQKIAPAYLAGNQEEIEESMVQYTRCFGTIKWRVRGFFEGKIQSPPSTDYSTLQTCIALETKFTSIAPGSYIYDTSNSFNYLHQFEKSTNKVLKKEKIHWAQVFRACIHHLS